MAKDRQNCLYKSEEKWLNGVVGGIAEHHNWDANFCRILFIIGLFSPISSALILFYIAMMFFMTDSKDNSENQQSELIEDDDTYCETDKHDDGRV